MITFPALSLQNGCGSGVEPASCYRKVAGLIFPGLHDKVSLGNILNSKLLLMCWSATCMAATVISVWMYVWIIVSQFGRKRLLESRKCASLQISFRWEMHLTLITQNRWVYLSVSRSNTGRQTRLDYIPRQRLLLIVVIFWFFLKWHHEVDLHGPKSDISKTGLLWHFVQTFIFPSDHFTPKATSWHFPNWAGLNQSPWIILTFSDKGQLQHFLVGQSTAVPNCIATGIAIDSYTSNIS